MGGRWGTAIHSRDTREAKSLGAAGGGPMPESHRQCVSGRTGDRECALGGTLAAGWPHAHAVVQTLLLCSGTRPARGALQVALPVGPPGAYWDRFPSSVQISQVAHLQTRPDRVTARPQALQRRPLAQSQARGTPAPAAHGTCLSPSAARCPFRILLPQYAGLLDAPTRQATSGLRAAAPARHTVPGLSWAFPRLLQRGLLGVRSQGRGPGVLDECPFVPESL